MEPTILYEDSNYIVFNKPAGLVVHSDGKTPPAGGRATLADWLMKNHPEMKEVGEPLVVTSRSLPAGRQEKIFRPGIVHRLDKETSGAIVVAKNAEAFADLKEKFKNREVKKKYQAFVYGDVKEDDDTINRPIGRSRKDFRKWSAQRGARGEMREAITNYKVLARGEGATYVEVEPKTGRTHQIRVHFKAIHHPIVADSLYAPKHSPVLGFERLALHAIGLSFTGIDGKKISVAAPYPEDFKKAIETLKKA